MCFVLSALLSLGLATPGHAQQGQGAAAAPTSAGGTVTLFQNVRIFDGKSGRLSAPSHVLVRGNRIERISATPIPADRRADTMMIDGAGRTLMPGLIDNHWHTMLVRSSPEMAMASDIGYTTLLAAAEATTTPMRGIRDHAYIGAHPN